MRISVIVPAYNCAEYLVSVIDSIYGSGLNVFEIIMVNDGSTDDTEHTIEMLTADHPELRIINQENRGVSAARNNGLSKARGDYVFFIDADDSLESGSLSNVDGILDAEQPDMLLFGMFFDYYHRGKMYRSDVKKYHDSGRLNAKTAYSEFENLFLHNMLSPVWNKLIRRELLVSNRISFREDMIEMEDYLFSVQCLSECADIYVLNNAVYHYRQSENERGTFNRLLRVPSLSRYVEPFYDAVQWFDTGSSEQQKVFCVADMIYSMLFHEQIRFASIRQIRAASEDMLSCEHSKVIAASDPVLFQKLENRQYASVWLKCSLRQLRHIAAVELKYLKSMRKSK